MVVDSATRAYQVSATPGINSLRYACSSSAEIEIISKNGLFKVEMKHSSEGCFCLLD